MQLSKLLLAGGVLALSATTATAAATQVNIVDPNATTRSAHVEPGNRLAVQEVPPTSFVHGGAGLAGSGCLALAPPAGKAMIVRQVRVSVTAGAPSNPPGSLQFFSDTACNANAVGGVWPTVVGGAPITITFDPGVAVPASGGFSFSNETGLTIVVWLDGYSVPASAAPAVGGQTLQTRRAMQGQR